MENIIKKILEYYPISAEALEALTSLFNKHVFPAKLSSLMQGDLTGKFISLNMASHVLM